jgi:hypothetical protein
MMDDNTTAPVIMSVELPTEPSIGSVVLASDGVAWQRSQLTKGSSISSPWLRAGTLLPMLSFGPVDGSLPWHRLVTEQGPLSLVYRSSD